MEFEVKKSLGLEDGKHEGIIEKVEYRYEPYEYTDVFVKEKETGFMIKYGCPSLVTDKSKLGKLISRFKNIEVGEKIDPEKILVGKNVVFLTITEKAKDGNEYNVIVSGSLKPKEE